MSSEGILLELGQRPLGPGMRGSNGLRKKGNQETDRDSNSGSITNCVCDLGLVPSLICGFNLFLHL